MNIQLLRAIANATAANAVVYVTQNDAVPFMQHNPQLISIDPNAIDPSDGSKRGASVTEAGVDYLNQHQEGAKTAPQFSVQAVGFERPKVKRVGGFGAGAPTKYPFETMEKGTIFFVANSDVAKGDAVKTMNSAVGSANQRFAVEKKDSNGNVIMKPVTRAKRGDDNKAIKGPDGKNITETVQLPEKEFTRKFVVSRVEGGKQYGEFVAPADGAVVMRSE